MDKLLTAKDLAERWSCAPSTVMDRLRTKSVPFVWLGPGEPSLRSHGVKLLRFRIDAIEAYERQDERTFVAEPLPKPAPVVSQSFYERAGWDGIKRI